MGAVRADLERVQRQPQVVDRAGRRGEVVDEVDVLGNVDLLDDVDVAEVEGVVADVLDVLQRPRLQVVDADHPMALAKQVLAQMGAEEPGASGDYAGAHRPDATGAWAESIQPSFPCNFRSFVPIKRPFEGRGEPRPVLPLACLRNRFRAVWGGRSEVGTRGGETTDARRKRLAVEIVAQHERALKLTARRYSLCAADAEDAYQRALEILLTKAPGGRCPRIDPLDADRHQARGAGGAAQSRAAAVRNAGIDGRRRRGGGLDGADPGADRRPGRAGGAPRSGGPQPRGAAGAQARRAAGADAAGGGLLLCRDRRD